MAFIQTGKIKGQPVGYYRLSDDQYPSNKRRKKMIVPTNVFKINKKGK